MKKQTIYDEHFMKCIEGMLNNKECPIGQKITFSSNTYTITVNHLFDFFNYTGRQFSVIINGGYKDGKTKVQSIRSKCQ